MKKNRFKKNIFLALVVLIIILPGCEKKPQEASDQFSDEPITVYSHGYLSNKWLAQMFHRSIQKPNIFCKNAFILGRMKAFNYADWFNPLATHLGQDADIEKLHAACKDHKKVILVGVSRGAAAIINYLAVYKPTNILGAIVESPFDNVENVADFVLQQHGIQDIETLKNKLRPIFFHNYHRDGLQPITTAAKVPQDIPLLIISSAQDTLIPESSTEKVFTTLIESGHKKACLLKCENGSHARILWGKDGQMFRNVVHAFYKHHGVPYHEEWAQDGHERLKACPGFNEAAPLLPHISSLFVSARKLLMPD